MRKINIGIGEKMQEVVLPVTTTSVRVVRGREVLAMDLVAKLAISWGYEKEEEQEDREPDDFSETLEPSLSLTLMFSGHEYELFDYQSITSEGMVPSGVVDFYTACYPSMLFRKLLEAIRNQLSVVIDVGDDEIQFFLSTQSGSHRSFRIKRSSGILDECEFWTAFISALP